MNKVSRTKNCRVCGNINFEIVQNPGSAEYYCCECRNYEGDCKYDEYETLENVCHKCGEEKFKIKIKVENSIEHYKFICSNCGAEPRKIYIDKNNNEISEEQKEALVIDERIEKIDKKTEGIDEKIYEIDEKIEEMQMEIDDLTNDNRNLQESIYELEDYISKMRKRLDELEFVVNRIDL